MYQITSKSLLIRNAWLIVRPWRQPMLACWRMQAYLCLSACHLNECNNNKKKLKKDTQRLLAHERVWPFPKQSHDPSLFSSLMFLMLHLPPCVWFKPINIHEPSVSASHILQIFILPFQMESTGLSQPKERCHTEWPDGRKLICLCVFQLLFSKQLCYHCIMLKHL